MMETQNIVLFLPHQNKFTESLGNEAFFWEMLLSCEIKKRLMIVNVHSQSAKNYSLCSSPEHHYTCLTETRRARRSFQSLVCSDYSFIRLIYFIWKPCSFFVCGREKNLRNNKRGTHNTIIYLFNTHTYLHF